MLEVTASVQGAGNADSPPPPALVAFTALILAAAAVSACICMGHPPRKRAKTGTASHDQPTLLRMCQDSGGSGGSGDSPGAGAAVPAPQWRTPAAALAADQAAAAEEAATAAKSAAAAGARKIGLPCGPAPCPDLCPYLTNDYIDPLDD